MIEILKNDIKASLASSFFINKYHTSLTGEVKQSPKIYHLLAIFFSNYTLDFEMKKTIIKYFKLFI